MQIIIKKELHETANYVIVPNITLPEVLHIMCFLLDGIDHDHEGSSPTG